MSAFVVNRGERCARLIVVMLVLSLFAGFLAGCGGDPNDTANRAFVGLAGDVSGAMAEPDPVKRFDRLSDVERRVDELLKRYPGTNVAVRIAAGEKIGTLSMSDLQNTLKALAANPRLCERALTRSCLLDMLVTQYEKLEENTRKVLSASLAAIAIRSDDKGAAERLTSDSVQAKGARADAITVGYFLADEARRNPDGFWPAEKSLLGDRFGNTTDQVAFGWALMPLFGGAATLEDVRAVEKVVALAPDASKQSVKQMFDWSKGHVFYRMDPTEIVASFDSMRPDERKSLDSLALGRLPADVLSKLPPELLAAVSGSLYPKGVPLPALMKGIDMAPSASVKTTLIKTALKEYGDQIATDDFVKLAGELSASERSTGVFRGILASASKDRQRAETLATLLAKDDLGHAIMTNLVMAIASRGYSDDICAAVRADIKAHVISVNDPGVIEMYVASDGALSVRELIDAFVEWGDSKPVGDAGIHNTAEELLQAGSKYMPAPLRFSDADFKYLVSKLSTRQFLSDDSLADRMSDWDRRGFHDIVAATEKRVTAKANPSDTSDPRRYVVGLKMDRLIRDEKYADAVKEMAILGAGAKADILEDPLRFSRFFGQPLTGEQIDGLYKAAADAEPEALFRALTRQEDKLARSPKLLELALRLQEKLKIKSESASKVLVLKKIALYRSRDPVQLKQDVFSAANPFAATESAYLLMDALNHGKTLQ